MNITNYLEKIKQHHESGHATEHTYRGNLAGLIEDIVQDVHVTNEPRRQDCGAPDYILTKKGIPIGFIEAKNIGDKDLEGLKENKDQFDRYKDSLNNLIFTDYINFYFYRDGNLVAKIDIAKIEDKSIKPLPNNFEIFEDLIMDFTEHIGQSIKNPKQLSEMMAGKARLLSDIIGKALSMDVNSSEKSTLNDQFLAFKKFLIHDITPSDFADVYAQTIAYGMFAARLHDPTLETFSRQEAAELIPKSNPFLRKLFGYIAGPDIDDRIKWVVDNLSEIFLACNVMEILKDYGKSAKMEDPIIHFYETFLSEYDPKLRKQRGVWYTPKPIVKFIVRAVDDILKTDFDLSQGIADTEKTKIKLNSQTPDKRSATGYKQIEQEVHKVQILDPATGTGTFLTEVINNIYQKFQGQKGIWSNYVESNLLPRLNGFEILMASYAMAHLKLDLFLRDTGFKPTYNQRFNIFLTNSLEEYHPDTGTLFASWLSDEANKANYIKRDTPVMCVIGNPPYAVSSVNKNDWIQNLISDYKKGLKERKLNLDDDYIKFIRYGQHFIDKNGSGILAFISNNSFIDGITHHQMRKSLVKTFNKIYVIDLHGNSNKKEKHPDGSPDENVFDIQQGVSINIFVKSKNSKKSIKHFDVFGRRNFKYEFLNKNQLDTIKWNDLEADEENCFFTKKDLHVNNKYHSYLSICDLMPLKNSGIQTKKDAVNINFSEAQAESILKDFKELEISELRTKYNLQKDGRDWTVEGAKSDARNPILIHKEQYRPFDYRYSFYTGKSKGLVAYPREKVSKHIIEKENHAICFMRQVFQDTDFSHVFYTKAMVDERTMYSNRGGTYISPLYLYDDTNDQQVIDQIKERRPNLEPKIVNKIAKELDLKYTKEKEATDNSFAPIDILDYIYAILHSPTYRKKYKEFLRIDFPKIPYPTDKNTFWSLVKLGREIRQIHSLESPDLEQFITQYPIEGDNVVGKSKYKDDKVFINDTQYFSGVSKVAWEFFIGGYQPAQKWLKDRKGHKLEFDDILHYQKIIVALSETDRLMKEIDDLDWFR